MGKASKKIASALRLEHEALSNKYNPDKSVYEGNIKLQFTRDELITELSEEIQNKLFNYSINTGMPLCEYLDQPNMKNFIQWVLTAN